MTADADSKSISIQIGDGEGDGAFMQTVNRSAFKRMRIEALGGRDDVAVLGRLGKPLTINGGSGSDRLAGGIGAETINGGGGNDKIFAFGAGGDVQTLSLADLDKVEGWTQTFGDTDEGGSLLSGGRGDDTLTGSPAHDTITGGAGRDIFRLDVSGGTLTFDDSDGTLPLGDDELTSIELTLVSGGGVGWDVVQT